MIRLGALFLFVFCVSESKSQCQGNFWLNGDSVALRFDCNSNQPYVETFPIWHGAENYASIADSVGNLLFYLNGPDSLITNNYNVYNFLGELMENGDSINTNSTYCNGTLILPFPNQNGIYLMIYLSNDLPNLNSINLSYSIINMNANGGLGKVSLKNQELITNHILSEKLAAVRHANGRDWWIITRGAVTNAFWEFLLTPTGLSSPIEIDAGIPLTDSTNWGGSVAQIVFNQKGNKLAMGGYSNYNGIFLFDFDRCSGAITNPVRYGASYNSPFYGCSFSPDGSKVYGSDLESVFQFDLNNPDTNNITQIWQQTISAFTQVGQQELGPDGRIYISSIFYNGDYSPLHYFDTTNMYLTVINNPDSLGFACNVSPYSYFLNSHRARFGLPHFPNYNLSALDESVCDTLGLLSEEINKAQVVVKPFYPNPTGGESILEYLLGENDKAEIIISDVLGRVVYKKILDKKGTKLSLDTKQFAEGIYKYRVTVNGEAALNNKLIVIKP